MPLVVLVVVECLVDLCLVWSKGLPSVLDPPSPIVPLMPSLAQDKSNIFIQIIPNWQLEQEQVLDLDLVSVLCVKMK